MKLNGLEGPPILSLPLIEVEAFAHVAAQYIAFGTSRSTKVVQAYFSPSNATEGEVNPVYCREVRDLHVLKKFL